MKNKSHKLILNMTLILEEMIKKHQNILYFFTDKEI